MLTYFTDTDTDITPAVAKEYGCRLISMPFSIDGRTVFPYEDAETFDFDAFYNRLREGTIPNTSGISVEKYVRYFEPEFAAGNDILYVHFSRAMSVTFNAMDQAVAGLLEKYPGRKFYDIDTKGITINSYMMVRDIGDMLNRGVSPEEIVSWAEGEVDKYAMYFFADDLKFFHHSGRVGGLAATMGTLLGVRPIIYMSSEGRMESIAKERGRGRAVAHLVSRVRELGDHVEDHRVVIGHTDALDIAKEVGEALQAEYGGRLNIEYVTTNPTAGSHCGPNGVGVTFHAIHR